MLHGLPFDQHQFTILVNCLVQCHNITSILETGTHKGTGTTQILAATGLPTKTIECNKGYHTQAVANLKKFNNCQCLHGYSLPRQQMTEFIRHDNFNTTGLTIAKDVADEHYQSFYLSEIDQGTLPENLLVENLATNQLVFLDSAGGVGWLEFLAVYGSAVRPLLIVFDDVDHVKHYRSVCHLREQGRAVGTHNRWAWTYLS